MKKKLLSLLVIFAMILAMLPVTAFAADTADGENYLDLSINGKEYSHVVCGEPIIIGSVDPTKADIKILTFNGNKLQNVGTKSGVKDSQGRTVLETNMQIIGEGVWNVRFCFHAEDDPIASNRAFYFDMPKIVFKSTADSSEDVIKAPAVSGLKAKAKKGAVTLSWKSAECTGYTVQYALNKNFKKAIVKNVTKKTLKISKLKKGKKYYVRVRAYVDYHDALGNAQTVTGAWKSINCKAK